MSFSIAMIGAGQFAGQFAELFSRHPLVSRVYVTDVIPERAAALASRYGLDGVLDDADAAFRSPEVDAVAVFTQRWTHGALSLAALRAGKHVYSTVPMGIREDEIGAIVDEVRRSGLVYMMGETSHYNPAAVYARQRVADGGFGRLFFAEGDYVHDMDLGFYDAYRYSGGERWRATASFPPLLYPTHSLGGILGAWETHAVSVSAIGVRDDRGDGVFDRSVSDFDNDFSNATALFEAAGGGSFRTNEFRRVGYPSPIRESRFRYFGTEGSFEETATTASWYDRETVTDVSSLVTPASSFPQDDPSLAHVSPALRASFSSGSAPVHDRTRLPEEFRGAPDGHEGSHHFLVDDFARAVEGRTLPPVNAWRAARYTLPGIVAHESARRDGERLVIHDLGDAPASL